MSEDDAMSETDDLLPCPNLDTPSPFSGWSRTKPYSAQVRPISCETPPTKLSGGTDRAWVFALQSF